MLEGILLILALAGVVLLMGSVCVIVADFFFPREDI